MLVGSHTDNTRTKPHSFNTKIGRHREREGKRERLVMERGSVSYNRKTQRERERER